MQFIYSGVMESLSIWGKDSMHVYECMKERKASFLGGWEKEDCWTCSSSPVLTSLSCWTPAALRRQTRQIAPVEYTLPRSVNQVLSLVPLASMSVPSIWKTLTPLVWHYHLMRHENQLCKPSFTSLYLLVCCIIHALLAKILLTLILITEVNGKLWVCHEVCVYTQPWSGVPFLCFHSKKFSSKLWDNLISIIQCMVPTPISISTYISEW